MFNNLIFYEYDTLNRIFGDYMFFDVSLGLLIPFIGTALGSLCVIFIKNKFNNNIISFLNGSAAGIMIAASVWSLIIPSVEQSQNLERFAFIPAVVGFLSGSAFLLFIEKINLKKSKLNKTSVMVFAVTLHNIPEGMAVGVVYAGLLSAKCNTSLAAALALSIGIGIQNLPEGAIISMPLKAKGVPTVKSLTVGLLSGIVEPIAGVITLLLSFMIIPALPYFLSFAAGAMIFVAVNELIPEMKNTGNYVGIISFSIGFSIMMLLDIALG